MDVVINKFNTLINELFIQKPTVLIKKIIQRHFQRIENIKPKQHTLLFFANSPNYDSQKKPTSRTTKLNFTNWRLSSEDAAPVRRTLHGDCRLNWKVLRGPEAPDLLQDFVLITNKALWGESVGKTCRGGRVLIARARLTVTPVTLSTCCYPRRASFFLRLGFCFMYFFCVEFIFRCIIVNLGFLIYFFVGWWVTFEYNAKKTSYE